MYKSTLRDRILWYDGDISVNNKQLTDMILNAYPIDNVFIEEFDDDIEEYNKWVPSNKKLSIKGELKSLSYEWNIPDYYKNMDVKDYILDKLSIEIENMSKDDKKSRLVRVLQEIKIFEDKNLIDVLKTIIFVIDTFKEKNIVWGVGRGSSVASYVLYLINVHDVDSILYDLDIKEFIK